MERTIENLLAAVELMEVAAQNALDLAAIERAAIERLEGELRKGAVCRYGYNSPCCAEHAAAGGAAN